jgi:hypothetical protein
MPIESTDERVTLSQTEESVLQKGGFLGSLLAPIPSVVAPLLSTLFQ